MSQPYVLLYFLQKKLRVRWTTSALPQILVMKRVMMSQLSSHMIKITFKQQVWIVLNNKIKNMGSVPDHHCVLVVSHSNVVWFRG